MVLWRRRALVSGATRTWRALLASPPALFILGVSAVNLLWLVTFLLNLYAGDALYVFPRGLREFISPRLTVRDLDLTEVAVILYNLSLVVGPVSLLAVPSLRRWCEEVGSETAAWLGAHARIAAHATIVAIGALILATVVADHTRLPFLQERVRWATDWFPMPVPLDPPLLVRTEYFLTRVLDARYAFVLANVLFHITSVVYLVGLLGGPRNAVPVSLAYLGIASHFHFLYFLNGADGELPAAVFGLIGFIEVSRHRYVGGTLALSAGLLFKPAAAFYALAGVGLVGWRLARRRVPVGLLPWGLAAASLAVVGLFYVGFMANTFVLRGGGYLFQREGEKFFLTASSTFISDFLEIYTLQLAIALVGLLAAPQDRAVLAYLLVSTFALRSLVSVAGGYYTVFFEPLWALLAARLLVRLWEAGRLVRWLPVSGPAVASSVGVLALLANLAGYVALPDKAAWVSRANSGWDALITKLDRELPRGTTVFFRKVSPRYDLERRGRNDLQFSELSLPADETLRRLAQQGPVAYVTLRADLEDLRGDLRSLRYEEVAAFGGVDGRQYVVFLKQR